MVTATSAPRQSWAVQVSCVDGRDGVGRKGMKEESSRRLHTIGNTQSRNDLLIGGTIQARSKLPMLNTDMQSVKILKRVGKPAQPAGTSAAAEDEAASGAVDEANAISDKPSSIETSMLKDGPHGATNPVSDGQNENDELLKSIGHICDGIGEKYAQRVRVIIEQERQRLEDAYTQRVRTLLTTLADGINSVLYDTLNRAVQEQFNAQSVQIFDACERAVRASSQGREALVAEVVRDSMSSDEVRQAFASAFREELLPSLELSTRNFLGHFNTTMSSVMEESILTSLTEVESSLQTSVEHVEETLRQLSLASLGAKDNEHSEATRDSQQARDADAVKESVRFASQVDEWLRTGDFQTAIAAAAERHERVQLRRVIETCLRDNEAGQISTVATVGNVPVLLEIVIALSPMSDEELSTPHRLDTLSGLGPSLALYDSPDNVLSSTNVAADAIRSLIDDASQAVGALGEDATSNRKYRRTSKTLQRLLKVMRTDLESSISAS